ncbi:hypothetical protein [Actinocorallia longicatena]|uniref:Uncharacterized protein n=1 Tax=Actinocorallia longicatena TaxID=111803 RepID=A0ABP6QEJ0_9ACTN
MEPDQLDRATLAALAREWLLHGHLQDRIGMPLLLETCDRETMQEVAIDTWSAVSPVYSRRARTALNFSGDDVSVIFKGMQLDIGAPHQFLDFRYRLTDAGHGEFFLASCGALLDVEPLGEDFVHGMCHTIEDPTFDATAGSVNPLAQVRPVHRPPRVPAGRLPHCAWTVVVADGAPVAPHPNESSVAASNAATITLPAPPPAPAEPGGWDDYSGPFDPDFQFEDLSHQALRSALAEIALQSHLLYRGFLLSVIDRFGADRAYAIMPRMLAGLAGITSERLCRALPLGGGAEGVAALLAVHPMLAPAGYLDVGVTATASGGLRLAIADCPLTAEPDGLTWLAPLADAPDGLASLVRPAAPYARVHPVDPAEGEWRAFEIVLDPSAEPLPEAPEVGLARFSTGATFTFERRRPVRT